MGNKRKAAALLILIGGAVIVSAPIYILGIGSFMAEEELHLYLAPLTRDGKTVTFSLFPMYFTLRGYVEVLMDTPEFFHMFWNSVKTTGCILSFQLLFAVPSAWGFARGRWPGKRVVFFLYIILMMLPFQVTMLSHYLILDELKLLDTQGAVIWPAVFSTFPVFLIHRFFADLPDGVIEAAQIDGAGKFQIFLQMGVPLAMPGIVSAMVLGFLEYWNLVEQPMTFLKSKELWPLSLYLPQISTAQAQMAFVASVITLIPALLIFLTGQSHLEQGISASAIKE